MLSLFLPEFSGSYQPKSASSNLIVKLAKRLATTGLFPLASPGRNQYEVVEQAETRLHFRSTSLWTGINVGLNDVQLRFEQPNNTIHYTVRYWSWAKYVLGLSLIIVGLCGLFLLPPVLGISIFPADSFAPVWQIKMFGLPMLAFWGFVWPWVLIALHKKHAARCLHRILDEVNELS